MERAVDDRGRGAEPEDQEDPGRQFANPSGTAPDPLNGLGGTGGGLPVNGTEITIVIPPGLPSGAYQVRVIGRAVTGQFLGSFSDAVTVVIP